MTSFLDELGTFPRNVALYGLRGVGKTCLLREYRVLALEAGCVTVRREFTQRVQSETTFATAFLARIVHEG